MEPVELAAETAASLLRPLFSDRPPNDNTTLNPKGAEHVNDEEWELKDEDLPEGSALFGSKFLLEDPPEVETSCNKAKKTKQGKGSKSGSKTKYHE